MQALSQMNAFVTENATKENFSRAAWGFATFCIGSGTATAAYNNIFYSVSIVQSCATPIINRTIAEIPTDLALGSLKIAGGCLTQASLNLSQYGLVLAGICATGYCIGRVIQVPKAETKNDVPTVH